MAQERESIKNLLKRADGHHDKKEYSKAIELYTQILNREPKNVEALTWRGEELRILGHYVDALNDLNKANTLKPIDHWILSSLGSTQIHVGDLENGIRNLEKSFKLDHRDRFTLQHLGFAMLLEGDFEEALNCLNEADKLDPNRWWTKWKRGIVYRKLGKLQKSYNDLKFAKELQPTDPEVKIDLADTFRELKLFQTGKELLSNINSPKSYIIQAHILIDLGNLTEAEKKLNETEPKLKNWMEIEHFRNVKKILEEVKTKQDPINLLEQISKSISSAKTFRNAKFVHKKLNKLNETLNECKEIYTAESGAGLVLELKRNIVEGEMKNTSLEKENTELKNENTQIKNENTAIKNENTQIKKLNNEINQMNNEKEVLLRCVICMEKARDTVVLPCLHFLFCSTCIQQHYTSTNANKCPSCRQTTTGNLNCRLEGERPIEIVHNSNTRNKSNEKQEKNGNQQNDQFIPIMVTSVSIPVEFYSSSSRHWQEEILKFRSALADFGITLFSIEKGSNGLHCLVPLQRFHEIEHVVPILEKAGLKSIQIRLLGTEVILQKLPERIQYVQKALDNAQKHK